MITICWTHSGGFFINRARAGGRLGGVLRRRYAAASCSAPTGRRRASTVAGPGDVRAGAATVALVVCDLAGTTVGDRGEVVEAFAGTLRELGIELAPAALERWRGASK